MTAEWENLREIEQWLEDIDRRCQHPEPAFRDSRQIMSRSIQSNFDAEGRPTRWARRVSDVNGNFKYPDKLTHPVLNKTGALMASAVRGDDYQLVITPKESYMDHGATVFYGVFHQSERPRKKLAWRPFLMFQDEDCDAIVIIFFDFITG